MIATSSSVFDKISDNSFLNFLKEYWVVLIGIGAGIILLSRKCFRFFRRIDKIDDIEKDVDSLKEDTNFIKGKVITAEKMLRDIVSGFARPSEVFVRSESPLKLTSKGKEILEGSKFKEIYKENKEKILKLVKENSPKLKYEAQETAISVMLNLKDDPMSEPLKKYAFANGINIVQVLLIAGIYLRDQIIKELNLKE